MPKISIDGQEIEVAPGTTVLQAALSRGREIPHYCYHAGLSIAGNCRMCLVEVEKAPKLVIACATQVGDGMVVHTQSAKVREAQAAVMEFLLINHPLDCPICDQAGECRLQEYAVEHGTGKSRYTEPKLALNKAVDIGPHVMLDQERCIQCSRCIRFCDEVTGTGELAFFRRGERTIIGTYPGKPLDNPYSGNVVDICPVGALTLKEFRFQTRVWYLKNTPSVCSACARGCNIMVAVGRQQELMTTTGQLDDRVKRIVPRVNEAVNGHWMCDAGRLSYRRTDNARRLLRAEAPAGSESSWEDAVNQAAARLKAAAEGGRLGAVLSPRLTSETLFAWKRLLDALGGARIGVQQLIDGEDDRLLVRADKASNATGAAWILGGHEDERAILDALETGKVDTLLLAGDPLDPADTTVIEEARRAGLECLIYAGPFADLPGVAADIRLPAAAWAEEEGTLVNFEGRVQRAGRAHRPRGEARPGWRVAADLAAAAGADVDPWTETADVLAALAAAVAEYEGLTAENIGLLGVGRGLAAAGR